MHWTTLPTRVRPSTVTTRRPSLMRHFVLVWCGEANQRSPKRPLALHNCPITGVEMVVWLIDWPVIGQVQYGETHELPHVVVVDVVDNTVGKKVLSALSKLKMCVWLDKVLPISLKCVEK